MYATMDDWLNEVENYGTRLERVPPEAMPWIETSWQLATEAAMSATPNGMTTGSGDVQEFYGDAGVSYDELYGYAQTVVDQVLQAHIDGTIKQREAVLIMECFGMDKDEAVELIEAERHEASQP